MSYSEWREREHAAPTRMIYGRDELDSGACQDARVRTLATCVLGHVCCQGPGNQPCLQRVIDHRTVVRRSEERAGCSVVNHGTAISCTLQDFAVHKLYSYGAVVAACHDIDTMLCYASSRRSILF